MSFQLDKEIPEKYVTVGATASAAIAAPGIAKLRQRGATPQLEITAENTDIIIAFGDDSVEANTTVDSTTFDREPGQHLMKAGAIRLFDAPNATHFSVMAADGVSTTGKLIILFGTGER